jgi:hypothetical protein
MSILLLNYGQRLGSPSYPEFISRAIWFRIPTEPVEAFWTQYPCFRYAPDESGQDSVNHAPKIEIGQTSVIVSDTCMVTFRKEYVQ